MFSTFTTLRLFSLVLILNINEALLGIINGRINELLTSKGGLWCIKEVINGIILILLGNTYILAFAGARQRSGSNNEVLIPTRLHGAYGGVPNFSTAKYLF